MHRKWGRSPDQRWTAGGGGAGSSTGDTRSTNGRGGSRGVTPATPFPRRQPDCHQVAAFRYSPMETCRSGANLGAYVMTPILHVLLAEDPTQAPLPPLLREIPTVASVAEATAGRGALPLIAAH